jgi:hypothetical protein
MSATSASKTASIWVEVGASEAGSAGDVSGFGAIGTQRIRRKGLGGVV